MSISKKLMTTGAKGPTYVDDVFSTYLYEGNGADRDIVNGIDLDGEGGMVWFKSRSDAAFHNLFDTERGASRRLVPNDTAEERYDADTQKTQTAFNSDGFSLGIDNQNFGVNNTGKDYASWTFLKAPSFFDVVTWAGDGVDGRVIPHSLGVTPGLVFVKSTSNSGNGSQWLVRHNGLAENQYLYLNENSAAMNSSNGGPNNEVYGMDANSLTFNQDWSLYTNAAGREYVAYVFAHDDSEEGLIQCGRYTGNGSTDGPEIDLGWEPQYLLIKQTNEAYEWGMFDNMRGLGTGADPLLQPSNADADGYPDSYFNLHPTGFSLGTPSPQVNKAGGQYIYMAIRRPNKPAEEFEAEELFAVNSAVSSDPTWVSGFPVDMNIQKNVIDVAGPYLWSRLMQGQRLRTTDPSVEEQEGSAVFDYQNGVSENQSYQLSSQYAWMWRRAPGYFDVVTYEGTGVARTVPHSLGVPPEMMWVKRRDSAAGWLVYAESMGNNYRLRLDEDSQAYVDPNWNFTTPDSSTFSIGTEQVVNKSGGDYVAYLFASVPGICDIGSYTGTGAQFDVDCGFTNGCRFLLIKRVDGTGGWYFWDSVRGINSNNGFQNIPYLLLNDTAAQTMATYITTLPSGFRVLLSSNAEINADGGEYIYMAIA